MFKLPINSMKQIKTNKFLFEIKFLKIEFIGLSKYYGIITIRIITYNIHKWIRDTGIV